MSKDPAILWYWNDWNGGTMTMNRHLKGCYIDLLNAQFNSGPLSLDQIKTVLGQDQAAWTVLSKKFKREVNSDGIEVFFNERMVSEKLKREVFTQKQKVNGLLGGRPKKPKNNPSLNPNESLLENEIKNENEIKDKGRGVGKGKGFYCSDLSKKTLLAPIEIETAQEYLAIVAQKNLTVEEVEKYWEAFKINQFSKKNWYNSSEDLLSHFRNSLKLELKNGKNGNQSTNSGDKLGTSTGRIRAAKKFVGG